MGQGGVRNTFSGNATYVIQAGEIHGDIRIGDLPAGTSRDRSAGDLARLVQAQWRDEAVARGLSRRARLAVRWTVDTAFADHHENIEGQLRPPGAEERGGLATMAESYRALPVRRLVILGDAGAGKTSLAILLTLELLGTLTDVEPVPVLLQLSSWNPETEHFDTWLARAVTHAYPSGSRSLRRARVRELVRDRRLLPVVDGLDELPRPVRTMALGALNRALGDDAPVILTSRTTEYAEAVDQSTVLDAATVIRARPVPGHVAADHLRTTAAPAHEHRWAPLLTDLTEHPDGHAAQALSSPLMLWLARTVYAPADSTPAELLDRAHFPEPAHIERHLLNALVPAAFRTGPPSPDVPRPVRNWGPQRAERWLRFLAAHLTRNRTDEFAWWRLHRARLPTALELPLGLLVTFLVLVAVHPVIVLLAPAHADAVATGVVAGAVCCLVLAAASVAARGRRGEVPGAAAYGRRDRRGTVRRPRDARALLRRERLGTARTVVLSALAAGAASGTFAPSPRARTAAFAVGACLAVAAMLLVSVWSRWLLAKALLAATGRLPLLLVTFLEDARRVGVLRQAGGIYQFRHARLQARLAAQHGHGTGRTSPSARPVPAPHDGAATERESARAVVFQGRTRRALLRGRAQLYAVSWGFAAARLALMAARDDWHSAGAWLAVGLLVLLPVPLDLFAPSAARHRSRLRLHAEGIEATVKGRTAHYRWADVTRVAVRLFDEDNRGAGLPMLHLLLLPGTAPAPGSRLDEEGWIALWPLGRGDETTVAPELDSALRRFAGARWAPWEFEE